MTRFILFMLSNLPKAIFKTISIGLEVDLFIKLLDNKNFEIDKIIII